MKRVWMVFFAMVALRVLGAPISQEVAVGRALDWMAGNPIMGAAERSVASIEVFPETGGYSVYVVGLEPAGYLVLNSDDRLPLVVSFSADSGVDLSDVPGNAFRAMLLRHVERMEEELAQLPAMRAAAAPAPFAVTELHGPFLEAMWNQCNPYNKLCPDDPEGSDYYAQRAPVGCVPTAYAQILNFHRWPFFGEGSRSYTDSSGGITGAHSAVFSDAYDWDSMQSAYAAFSANPEAAEDVVAELMYELGVAAGANYEHSGTSASTLTLGQRLGEYFFFEPCEWRSSQSALISPMEADLRAGFPCVVSIPGHAIVADGLMVDDGTTTYHINYGWGGSNNGWWSADNVAGDALQYGVTSLKPRLMAFPQTNAIIGIAGGSVELQWIFPKRREAEVGQLEIRKYIEQSDSWELFATDSTLASRRFSETTTLWDDCDDFSGFEITSTSTYKDWGISTTSGVANCFYKQPGGYGNREYHLTSYSTITPMVSTRLLLRTKYSLASDPFRVLVSIDRINFTEIWEGAGTVDWSNISIDLSTYAGQAVYVRLEYVSGSYYPNGGIWIDSVNTQEVTNLELEGQPVYYTVLTNLPAGLHTLAAVLTDTSSVEHGLGPAFTLTVDDGDGMPPEWEELYGFDTGINDGGLDPDDDSYSNFEEYICGTIPIDASSCWLLESGDGNLPSFYAMEGRLYTIQFQADLATGSWVPLISGIPGSNGTISVGDYDSATNSARYYRVQVQPAN